MEDHLRQNISIEPMPNDDAPLRFPHAEPPSFGKPVAVAPGILWLRLPLPFSLDHVNTYLIEDAGGWAIFDTGISDEPTEALWRQVIAETLGDRPVTKVIVSHFHPDHAGMAGWLHDRFKASLLMPQTEYFYSRLLQGTPAQSRVEEPLFYRALGLDEPTTKAVLNRGKSYLQRVAPLPPTYLRLLDGEVIEIGGRSWQILTGGGHAPEQAMLWCRSDKIFLSADQVLARISPNVSVVEIEPAADPLGLYIKSLKRIGDTVNNEVLVLPGHNLPFFGLQKRTLQLRHHHEQRCRKISEACVTRALSAVEMIPILFSRQMDPHQLSFALGEALAHLNYMVRRGELVRTMDDEHIVRYRSVSA